MDKLKELNIDFKNPLVIQIVVAIVFMTAVGVVLLFQRKSKQKQSTAAPPQNKPTSSGLEVETIRPFSGSDSPRKRPQQVDETSQAPSSPLTMSTANNQQHSPSFSQKLTNALDVEAFLRKLREEGISVVRLKNKQLKPKKLRLNDKGELYWAKSWFPKHIPLKQLCNVVEPIEAGGGFVLEFKPPLQPTYLLNLRIPEHEFPFDTVTVMAYFRAILKLQKQNPAFITRFLTNEAAHRPYVDDDGVNSDVSELTESTTPTVPVGGGSTLSRNNSGNGIRTPTTNGIRTPTKWEVQQALASSGSGKN